MMTQTASLSRNELDALEQIAGLIIPASAEFDVPGADDPVIMADLMATASPLLGELSEALSGFGDLDPASDRGATFRAAFPRAATVIQTLVIQCYYRDDQVMRSLDLEAAHRSRWAFRSTRAIGPFWIP